MVHRDLPEATETSSFAKNETERLIRAKAEARATDDTSRVRPREPIAESQRVTPLVVFFSLSLGLPGISFLAWLVIKADTRLVDRLDERNQADWIDDFLANWRQSLTSQIRCSHRQEKAKPQLHAVASPLARAGDGLRA
jgi:hypothetical protein